MSRISGGNCPFDIVLILNIHYWSLIYIDRRCTQVLRLKLLGTEERFSWKVMTGDRDRERIITMMTMTSTTRAMMINWWWRNIVQDVQRGGGESTQPDHTPGRFFSDKHLCFFSVIISDMWFQSPQYWYRLRFAQVREEEFTGYHCKATNSLGQHSAKITISGKTTQN